MAVPNSHSSGTRAVDLNNAEAAQLLEAAQRHSLDSPGHLDNVVTARRIEGREGWLFDNWNREHRESDEERERLAKVQNDIARRKRDEAEAVANLERERLEKEAKSKTDHSAVELGKQRYGVSYDLLSPFRLHDSG